MNIAYAEYRKKADIHGTVLYPATMVAPVQKGILMSIVGNNRIDSILDPFHGSGTALYEAFEVFPNAQLVGCDINPLASLITEVKLMGVDCHIEADILSLAEFIKNDSGSPIYTFRNSQKWFRDDIAKDLTRIRNSISRIESTRNRKFFWCMLCDIIRKYSNTRSSTYKLHSKPTDRIISMENHVVIDYIESISRNFQKYTKSTDTFTLYKADALQTLRAFRSCTFDISITSPPYGDNDTTVPYGQFSMLSLFWIDRKDLIMEGWELDSYYAIDNKSLGGYKENIQLNDVQLEFLKTYLTRISPPKQKKVLRFFSDYFMFLDELCRVTSQYIIMTLGNRRVDGVKINLTYITMKYIERQGFIKQRKLKRNILNKRTPSMTSRVDEQPVSSMDREYVIVYKRE